MNRQRRVSIVVLFLLGMLLSACARTHVTGVWQKKNFAGPPMQSLVILAQTGEKQNRSSWESIISERYRRSGMNTVAALQTFPSSKPVNLLKVIDYARDKGIDGVLVIRDGGTYGVETYRPPEVAFYYSPVWYPYRRGYPNRYPGPRRYYPRYAPSYAPYLYIEHDVFVSPGYTIRHQVATVESFLYVARTGEQVWSMATETVDPMSNNALISDISRSTFRGLRRARLILLSR